MYTVALFLVPEHREILDIVKKWYLQVEERVRSLAGRTEEKKLSRAVKKRAVKAEEKVSRVFSFSIL